MYQGRTLNIFNPMAALIAMAALAAGNVASAADATSIFNYPSGFASAGSAIRAAWESGYTGSAINLTPMSSQHQAGGVWYTTQQNITSFTTDFTFQITGANASGESISGFTFCVQNSNNSTDPGAFGTNAGGDANLLGYGA